MTRKEIMENPTKDLKDSVKKLAEETRNLHSGLFIDAAYDLDLEMVHWDLLIGQMWCKWDASCIPLGHYYYRRTEEEIYKDIVAALQRRGIDDH